MKRASIFKRLSVCLFTCMVLFTVSVRETHYLFTTHALQHEHCENHLHEQEEHAHCAVCHFDISSFTNAISFPQFTNQQFLIAQYSFTISSKLLATLPLTNPLRGPPCLD